MELGRCQVKELKVKFLHTTLSTKQADVSTGKMIWQLATRANKYFNGFLESLDEELFEIKYDQYRNRSRGGRSRTKPRTQRLEAIRLDGNRS